MYSNMCQNTSLQQVSFNAQEDTLIIFMVPHALEVVTGEPGDEVDFVTKDTNCCALNNIGFRSPDINCNPAFNFKIAAKIE